MYRIMIVDDEPAALGHLKKILEKRCPEFSVCCEAENGEEAFKRLEREKPDVIITDVKMPIMDGIELVRRIKTEYPEMLSLVVSGYQEFSYVRGAIQSEVCDYILKPVIPSGLMEAMEKIRRRLDQKYIEKRSFLLRKMCRGEEISEEILSRFFSESAYYLAIIRKNGLPRRFFAGRELENFSEEYGNVMFYGRDEREALYICPRLLQQQDVFPEMVEEFKEKSEYQNGYITVLMFRKAYPARELGACIREMYDMLNRVTTVGKSQTVVMEDAKKSVDYEVGGQTVLKVLEAYMEKGQTAQCKREIKKYLQRWLAAGYTQLQMEGLARHLYYLMQKYGEENPWGEEMEFLLEDAFFNASSKEELQENIEVFLGLKREEDADTKIDTEEFFKRVTKYVVQHLKEPLTLQQMCRQFGVSQTYLSRLFRKYGGTSYNTYVTKMRIAYARKVMEEGEELYIKDIAAMVGYEDPFYFSRIFRSVTGKCPSDYQNEKRTHREEKKE